MASALSGLAKKKAKRVLGIDCSTHALAFCIYYNRKPIKWGKINFVGANVFERMADASNKVRAVKDEFDVDYIVFESAILAKVSNADTTIKLAMVYGACIAELMRTGTQVVTVQPLSWQASIGNPNFKKPEKEALYREFPGKSKTWYADKIRSLRKQKTLDFFNGKFPAMQLTDDDVGDACGLAHYGYYQLTSRS